MNTGSLVGGHFRLIKRLAGGGFSDVWLAHDVRAEVNIVLKFYTPNLNIDEAGLEMFRKEFALVCNLSHSNVLKPFSLEIINDTPCLVLPYCEHGSALQLVGRITEEELWVFIEQVASGLNYLHKHNIIHQDIKPGNVLIDSDGQFLITDFGISTGLRDTIRNSRKDNESCEQGTIAYMSYECACSKPVNSLSRDIWALGATSYELISGQVPFGEYGGLTQKSENGKVPSFEPGLVSSDMKNLICKCLAFNPWDRPSAGEILRMVNQHKVSSTDNQRHGFAAWKQVTAIAAATLVAIVLYFGWFRHPSVTIPVNPNDSILIAVYNESSASIMAEEEKKDKLSIDETILANAATRFHEALSRDVTDTLASRIEDSWQESQSIIDKSYDIFMSTAQRYKAINAESAEDLFLKKSKILEPFISKSINKTPNVTE